ncbi:MAG: hypothetical protein LBV74_05280 [Tannerella sp.]|jgi:multisubunit Na+/H+ antiporter MnhB subunit|nr:hypothetical protein [Tannerella sp.]
MAVTKIRKISSWTMLIVSIISLAVFALFYFGGEDTPVGVDQFKNPTYTSELLIWMYILLAVCAISLVLFGVLQFANKFKTDPKGALMTLAVFAGFVILLVIAYFIGDATPLSGINADSQKFNVESWLKVTDMWIYAIYIMLTLSVVAIIWGSVKKVLNK